MQPVALRTAASRLTTYLLLILTLGAASARAAPLKLVVQPILPAAQTRQVYGALASYLSQATGRRIQLVTAQNFLTYWETMKRGDTYDLILDAAHFTDFRDERMGYKVLAKIPDTVSYSLVTRSDKPLFTDELVGKRVATLPPPSLGAVRLSEMFPHPMRQPILVRVKDSVKAIQMVLKGEVVGAIVPTPLLNEYSNLNVVATTPPVPHIALSAAPGVDTRTREAIRRALLNANKTPQGKHMLQVLKFQRFVAADNSTYKGYGHLLKGVWGY